jgi:hypothetical protein
MSARSVVCCAFVLCCSLAGAQTAAAAPPPNDNYLGSTILANPSSGKVARHVQQVVDTTEATTQADLFDPDKDGQPLGGDGPEPTTCNGVSFGKTIWYDVQPDVTGAGQITAGPFDTVIAVYRYDVKTAKITGLVRCVNAGIDEKLVVPAFKRGTAYTIQIGGVGGIGGALNFGWDFFPDRDGDGVLDETPDRCPNIPGPVTESGCPPRLSPSVTLTTTPAGGVHFDDAVVSNLPAGTRVTVRCSRCHVNARVTVRRTNAGVKLRGLVGRSAPSGAVLDIVATHPKARSGRFQFGAIGSRLRYKVRGTSLGRPSKRCLLPGSTKARSKCE